MKPATNGFIKADVSGAADTQDFWVDAASDCNLLFIAEAGGPEILGVTVGDVNFRGFQLQRFVVITVNNDRVVALWAAVGKPHVFVERECSQRRKRGGASLAEGRVDRKRGWSGGDTEYIERSCGDSAEDGVRGIGTDFLGGVEDDNLPGSIFRLGVGQLPPPPPRQNN